ncbi:hypothetical protein WKI65_13910 [Streptomyces sp. MS1.AVA.3]|uniref:hypothetical protein n=1 Tax=Streptomyces decoyicus TaxID=249567 RepID=UPI0030C4B251
MPALVLASVRTRLWQYAGVILVSFMSAGLLTLLASVRPGGGRMRRFGSAGSAGPGVLVLRVHPVRAIRSAG